MLSVAFPLATPSCSSCRSLQLSSPVAHVIAIILIHVNQNVLNPHSRLLLGFAAAQSTTLSIPFYGLDNQSIDASIVAANPTATTMALACPPGTDSNDCGLFPDMTLVYGPSTYHMDMGSATQTLSRAQRIALVAKTLLCVQSPPGAARRTFLAAAQRHTRVKTSILYLWSSRVAQRSSEARKLPRLGVRARVVVQAEAEVAVRHLETLQVL